MNVCPLALGGNHDAKKDDRRSPRPAAMPTRRSRYLKRASFRKRAVSYDHASRRDYDIYVEYTTLIIAAAL